MDRGFLILPDRLRRNLIMWFQPTRWLNWGTIIGQLALERVSAIISHDHMTLLKLLVILWQAPSIALTEGIHHFHPVLLTSHIAICLFAFLLYCNFTKIGWRKWDLLFGRWLRELVLIVTYLWEICGHLIFIYFRVLIPRRVILDGITNLLHRCFLILGELCWLRDPSDQRRLSLFLWQGPICFLMKGRHLFIIMHQDCATTLFVSGTHVGER